MPFCSRIRAEAYEEGLETITAAARHADDGHELLGRTALAVWAGFGIVQAGPPPRGLRKWGRSPQEAGQHPNNVTGPTPAAARAPAWLRSGPRPGCGRTGMCPVHNDHARRRGAGIVEPW